MAGRGDDRSDVAERGNQWNGAGDAAERSIEAELAEEPEPLDVAGRQLLGGDQQTDGDREVEPAAAFAVTRRSKVDRDPRRRPAVLTGHDRGANPVTRLAADVVGLADDREARQTRTDMHLDGDAVALCTEQGGGRNSSKHGPPPATSQPRGRIRSQEGARPHDVVLESRPNVSGESDSATGS